MKLFVSTKDGKKNYLQASACSRHELARQIGGEVFIINSDTFHVSTVKAEQVGKIAPVSAVIGSIVGVFSGIPGILLGGLLGALFGKGADQKEQSAIEAFNRS